ncbi:MAG: ComEC/Rec2 family competence protein [Candidatus Omnitrophica bacterium]|nr:ComEC/Rec2 family competence protein [Candidatus Omnitrophota bacterium]
MINRKLPVSCFFIFPFVLGILIQKVFPFPFDHLVIFFVFSGVFALGFSLAFTRISNLFLIFFIITTGIFIAGKSHIGYTKKLPFTYENIKDVVGAVKDVQEKGQFLKVELEKTFFSDGKKWYDADLKIYAILPYRERIYQHQWLYLSQINIKQAEESITVSAKSWFSLEPLTLFEKFIRKIHTATESIVKKWFRYHGQEAAIFRMMVLGDRFNLPEIKQVFIKAGTYHLLVVSGLHLGYLVIFLRIIFFFIRRIEQAHYKIFNLLYLMAIIIYCAITGFKTPVIRAALMFGIYIFSEIIERPVNGIESIGWAGSLILFFRPDELFSAGFQLSFAATTGIILAMRNIPHIKGIPLWLDSTIRAIIGAQVFTIPVLLGNFGRFYPFSLIANLILVPAGAIAVFLGLSFLIFAFFRQIIIFFLTKALAFFWIGTKLFSEISPEVSWSPKTFLVFCFYFIIFAVLFRNRWKVFIALAATSLLANALITKIPERNCQIIAKSDPKTEQSITIFPCKKFLCTIEKENRLVLIVSEKEESGTLKSAMENTKGKNKDIVFFFTGTPHDIISQLEFMLNYVKPSTILDNPDIKKNPAFGYRKCFFLADEKIKQDFWKFLETFEGLRVVYNERGNLVIEYKSKSGTAIISNYINATIFEALPFSPTYHTIYATKLALSKKLQEYLEDYKVKQVLYQKLTYETAEEPLAFKLIEIDKAFTITFK